MAVMRYRTEDGLADYGFSIEFQPHTGWRVYVGFTPVYPDRDDLRLPYQSIDDYGRPYVEWPSKLDSLGDARTVAGLWAEVIHRYQQTREQRQADAELIRRYQQTPEQSSPPVELDRLDDGAIVQQIRFGDHDFAVLDISPEVSTVNWTARVTPGRFVSEINRIADPPEAAPVLLQMSTESPSIETTVSPLRDWIRDEAFDMNCQFVRIDLSPTRSVAWQTLSGNGDVFTVVGMGEETERVAVGESKVFLRELLGATATSQVNSLTVISSLDLPLALQAGADRSGSTLVSYHGGQQMYVERIA
ncbi:MAG: hypothetical protein M3460_23960 [Actinomycetota bacterium]|nr:hypothetical protein [Actinomycetota bacterium]